MRRFDKHSFDQYRADAVSLDYDLVRRRHTSASLEFSHPYFTLDRLTTEHWFPFAWHLATHTPLGQGAYRLPFGPRRVLCFVLRRNSEPWQG